MSLPSDISEPLIAAGLLLPDDFRCSPLSGGVSCDIWKVESRARSFVVKRALPKLRVASEWLADVARNQHEQAYLKYVGAFLPDAVPEIYFSGPDFFAMECLDDGFSDWKSLLLNGKITAAPAIEAGLALGRIHSRSWQDSTAFQLFDTGSHFHDLRISPYLLASAQRNPNIAPLIEAEAARMAAVRLALVHGDYSPKNLMVRADRFVVLDCEVAWFGDPAFDVAFLVNHLLLKSIHRQENAEAFLALIPQFLAAYRACMGDSRSDQVLQNVPALLLCLLLARVDGKSPVEYLTNPGHQDSIRSFVTRELPHPPASIDELVTKWKSVLAL